MSGGAWVVIQGRCVTTPQMHTIRGGEMSTFSVVWEVPVRGSDGKFYGQPHYIDVVAFPERSASTKRLEKGKVVIINGRLRVEKFKRKDGTKGTSVKCILLDCVLATEELLREPSDQEGDLASLEEIRKAFDGEEWEDADRIPF